MLFKKHKITTIVTAGFALFAMFFGAGNLILPPYIGLKSGELWYASLIGFFITAILAPFLGVWMLALSGTSFFDLKKRIPPKLISVLALLIILCIGPFVAMPRTGAVAYEMGIFPWFPQMNNVVFSLAFFLLVLFLSVSQAKIVDIIGKILTPFLLISLLILIVIGLLNPLEKVAEVSVNFSDAFVFGFMEGYQTLDVLASVVFAGLIILSVVDKGYASVKERTQITIASGVISAMALFFIYGGLIYLGATTDWFFSDEIKRTELLLHISNTNLGNYGTYIISVAFIFACLTTAIALASACGMFFERISHNKIPYRYGVTISVLLSVFLSINSVDEIINYAVNILLFVYPITFVMILYILFFGKLVKSRYPYVIAMLVAAIISFVSILQNTGFDFPTLYAYKNAIPLSKYNLEWFLPSLIFFLTTFFIIRMKKNH